MLKIVAVELSTSRHLAGILFVSLVRPSAYRTLATLVLLFHALFIAWVALGALITRSRPLLQWLHVASLIWAILIEVFPWTCPLTYLEDLLESRGEIQPYQGGFLLHYLDKLVYPDISAVLLAAVAVVICGANLVFYGLKVWKGVHEGRKG